jgi:hypothetical protein
MYRRKQYSDTLKNSGNGSHKAVWFPQKPCRFSGCGASPKVLFIPRVLFKRRPFKVLWALQHQSGRRLFSVLSLLVLVAWMSAWNAPVGNVPGKLKSKITRPKYLKSISRTCRSSATCAKLDPKYFPKWMRLLAAFPVLILVRLASVPASKENEVDCGKNSTALFASYDPSTSSWKMLKPCGTVDVDSTECSVTWPRAGMTVNGIAYQRPTLTPRIAANALSLWPTPGASDGEMAFNRTYSKASILLNLERGHQQNLWNLLRVLDVPLSRFPDIYCWMMGFPAQWSDLNAESLLHDSKATVMPLCRPWGNTSETVSTVSTRH